MKTHVTAELIDTGLTQPAQLHRCHSELLGVVRANRAYRLVAVQPIVAGTVLLQIEGKLTQRPTRYSVQIEEGCHIDLDEGHSSEEILDRHFWRFMNHSCLPNTVIHGQDVIASCPIEPWKDVTFNYTMTEFDMAEPFECQCGNQG
ncbi:MAG: SET domain-containing protein-lysine N-methyltransferase [Pedosphaera sp.]|nr:SET domain-containing protein-lysine N-methyltransferase [Pedosphaera sp.]